ncbi:hypothetical protein V8E55_010630 [Tylopilus felleus]
MTLAGSSTVESHLHERGSDTASELLVAELVLNDIAAVQVTRKGKAREDAPRSDEDIAFDLQAASIDRAIESDTRQLGRLAVLERAQLDDRRAAVAMGDGHDLPRQTLSRRMMEQAMLQPARASPPPHREHATDTTEVDVEAVNVGIENAHITTAVTSKTVPREFTKLECVICGDEDVHGRSLKAPCGHRHCRGCTVRLVETSLRDERLHPLRCCHKPLPLEPVFSFISLSLRSQFLDKQREYSVPPGSRVYCSNPRCSVFLDASGGVERDLTCHECDTVSCSQCKNNAHPGEDCSERQSMLGLREMATANKWQTCPGCHAIVELSQGCYHIICRCSTQFCYLCSARWRTCNCRQWDEDRLLNDAERRVRNQFGNRAAQVQPAVHAERVFQRMEALRENHGRHDHFWMYRRGGGRCEECEDFLPNYLMRCVNCQTLVCRRCSVNRL